MTTETEVESDTQELSKVGIQNIKPIPAVLGGVIGTLAFGGMMQAMGNVGVIAMAIPALYGIPGPSFVAGWVVHLFHGAVLGLAYAVGVSFDPLRGYAERLLPSVGLGVAYGVVTAAGLGVVYVISSPES
ncbi:MAG: histidine kinase [Halobacteria archaeon]|nr:histidine kinase [Halobacteria archaeon]